jgi:hypothetical protein
MPAWHLAEQFESEASGDVRYYWQAVKGSRNGKTTRSELSEKT